MATKSARTQAPAPAPAPVAGHEWLLRSLAQELALRDPDHRLGRTRDEAAELARSATSLLADTADLWDEHLGGFYSGAGVARLLGGPGAPVTRQAVQKRRDLLALRTGSGQVVYPKAQFRDGRPLPGMAEILATLPAALVSPWTVASWLVSGTVAARDATPIALLREGDVAPVVAAARAWADALAA